MILWLINLKILTLCLMLKHWLVIFQLLQVKLNQMLEMLVSLDPISLELEEDLRKKVQVVLVNQRLMDKLLMLTVAALVAQ